MAGDRYHRRSIRLRGYDYCRDGLYFVTICTHEREHIFGEIRNGMMGLNEYGSIAAECWQSIPHHFPHVKLDAFIVMPNHLHGVLYFKNWHGRGVACNAPTAPLILTRPPADALGTVIGSFKSAVTKRINSSRDSSGARVWQRNYYENIIRSPDALMRIRRYILRNPKKWPNDRNAFYE